MEKEKRERSENQNRLMREKVFNNAQPADKIQDPKILPKWAGVESIEHIFMNKSNEDGYNGYNDYNEDMEHKYGGNKISKLLDGDNQRGLYLRFFCDEISDSVYEFLGFKEVIQTMIALQNEQLNARIYDTAPVFKRLCISDWNLELGGKFVKYFGAGDVFTKSGLFKFKNPTGLQEFVVKYSTSLNAWLSAVPWNALKEYLEAAKALSTVIIGSSNNSVHDQGLQFNNNYDRSKMDALFGLFSSLVTAKVFIVESAPFSIDRDFITDLSTLIADLRLYDRKILWNPNFLESIKKHFGGLKRLGCPANCIDMPTLVSILEQDVEELVIRNLDNKSKLQMQDLAILFERFERIEIDSSLITEYPSIKNKTKLRQLSIQSDTHNFFIFLLKKLPSSVRHLVIKNTTYSTNNLVFDVSQANKYNTKAVNKLTLEGFETNLKQIANLLNYNLFKNLRELEIVTRSRERKLHIIEQEMQSLYKASRKIRIKASFKPHKY